MKIRSNFVSNSSSTSYIIEFDDIDKIVSIAGEMFSMSDFFEAITSNMYDSETEMHECTYEDSEDANLLIERLNSMIKWADEANEKDKQKLIELKNDILSKKNGKYFARFDINYHNKALNFLFKLLKKYELFTVRLSSEE